MDLRNFTENVSYCINTGSRVLTVTINLSN